MVKKIILFSIVFMMLLILGCSNNVDVTIDEVRSLVETSLQDDESISEFKINNFEFSHENQNGEKVYLLNYSMKPTDPKNYILAGSGVKGEDGWINDRVYYITYTKKEELVFSTSP